MVCRCLWSEGWDIPHLVSCLVLPPSNPETNCPNELHLFHRRMSVAPHVLGKSRSVYRAFETESEAYIWLQSCLLRGTVELIN